MSEMENALREQLYAAFKHRAILYYVIFDELRAEIGQDKAIAVMQRAIRRRGTQIGEKFRQFAPDDLAGLRDAFVAGIPDDGRMFSADVQCCDDTQLDIVLTTCPLRDAWREIGLADEEVALMCRVAAVIDNGTFEGAGFEFSAETWTPNADGCCHLHIRPGAGDQNAS